jgi:hypothetical protein
MARKILRKSLQELAFVAGGAGTSYNPPVTNDEIWRGVGAALAARRIFEGYETPNELRRKIPNAPDVRMMLDVERGVPRTVTLLAKYCDVLGVSLATILADVLAPCDVTPLALQVARAFDAMPLEAQPVVLPTLRLLRDTKPGGSGSDERPATAPATPGPRAAKTRGRRR